jgi:hypothetical protein
MSNPVGGVGMAMKPGPIFNFRTIVLIGMVILYFAGTGLYRHYDSRRAYFSEERFHVIKAGWKKEAVITLLGKPDWENVQPGGSNFQYVNRPKKDPTKFEFMIRRNFVIVFDDEGRVIDKEENFAS